MMKFQGSLKNISPNGVHSSQCFISDMKHHTTLKVGCPAQLYQPQNSIDLCNVLKELDDCYVLGNGSNLLVGDSLSKPVVSTKRCNDFHTSHQCVYIEAGCMMPSIISKLKNKGLGGIEYFASIPATLGGAIYMNAGRGFQYNLSIGQRVKHVDVFDVKDNKSRRLSKEECRFDYRSSIFHQHPEWVIIGAELTMTSDSAESIVKKIKERIAFTRSYQDLEFPNAGSVFSYFPNGQNLKGVSVGGARYSHKTHNWIVNFDNATYSDIQQLIAMSPKNSRLEWSVWS